MSNVEELFAQHHDGLVTYVMHVTGASREEAEDACSVAWSRVLEGKMGEDVIAKGKELAWLRVVARREARGKRKRDSRIGSIEDMIPDDSGLTAEDMLPASSADVEAEAELAEMVGATAADLAALKPQERRALGLLALGLSYQEIMEVTGWTWTKVNRCIAEGRAALRKMRDERGEE